MGFVGDKFDNVVLVVYARMNVSRLQFGRIRVLFGVHFWQREPILSQTQLV